IRLFGGLGGGNGGGLMREYFDDTVHTRKQLQVYTAMPVLAVLPQLSPVRQDRHGLLGSLNQQGPNEASGNNERSTSDAPLDQLAGAMRRPLSPRVTDSQ